MITNEEIIEWVEKQHIWVGDAISTFYKEGKFKEDDVERFADTCLLELKKQANRVEVKDLNLLKHNEQGSLALCSISNVEGVNALKSGQSLKFSPQGITVVYGDNGAGKSSYIRIIKQISNAKYREDIRGNVYKKSNSGKHCDVKIRKNGKDEVLACDISVSGEHDILRSIDIFDTKISKAYVEMAKEASYEPWIFSMLSAIANITTQIKVKLEEKKKHKTILEIKIPEELRGDKRLEVLSENISDIKIDKSDYIWENTDEQKLHNLIKQSNSDILNAEIKQLSGSISSIDRIIFELKKYSHFYTKENVKRISELKKAWDIAREKKILTMKLFQDQALEVDKESVKDSAWISLWKSANKYYDVMLSAKGEIKYNIDGGTCPLCRQKIKKESLKRIQSIEEYINGETSMEEENSKSIYISELLKLTSCWSEEETVSNIESSDIQNIQYDIMRTLDEIRFNHNLISQKKYDELDIVHLDIEGNIKRLEDIKLGREIEKNKKNNLLTNEEHIRTQNIIKELKVRKFLCNNIEDIISRLDTIRLHREIDKAESFLNTKAITTLSNRLANELISEDYINRFNIELKKLTKGTVSVTLKQQKGGKGKVPFKVELLDVEENASPADVLSEGENRVVSLAAFFSEASGRDKECPLIVDDPISSLDYTYEEAVISRLVEAAKYRQVIVFTHRISMAVGINEVASKKGVTYTELRISGRGREKGVPITSAEYGGKVLSGINNLINTNIAQIKKIDINDALYDEKLHYVCQQMRIIVEKSVEDILLNEVVKRFRRDIQTKGRLTRLADISVDDCKLIDDMMTKYSYYDHSMSDETPLSEFSIEDIEDDALRFKNWIIQKQGKK